MNKVTRCQLGVEANGAKMLNPDMLIADLA